MPFLGQSPAAVITGNGILDGTVTAADLHTTLDLSGKTITYPSNSVTATALHTTAVTDKLGYTPLQSSDLTGYATESYVTTAISNLVDSAPGTLDTLNELAAALGDDANYASTITSALALKAPLASPSFTGNVGIGTSSPNEALHVIGNGRFYGSTLDYGLLRLGGENNNFIIGYDSTHSTTPDSIALKANAANGYVYFSTNGLERMRINSSGNVGIGTSSPTSDLHINRNGSDVGIRINCADTTGTAKLQFGTQSDVVSTAIQFDASDNSLQYRGFDNTERMRIDSSGSVCIATTSAPSTTVKLDVAGAIEIGANKADNSYVPLTSGTMVLRGSVFAGTPTYTYIGNGTVLGVISTYADSTAAYARFLDISVIGSSSGTGTMRFLTGSTTSNERMRITSAGRVGIGTDSPVALLDVNGVGAFGAGSASAPSITYRSDTSLNTGMYFPGENQVALSTAGNVRLNISSSGTMIASKYNGTAASPTESADWPTPILALRGYGNFTQESMLSFGYSNDDAYQTGNNVWGFRLNGDASATTSSSSTHLNLVGPGRFYLYSNGDAIFSPGGSEKAKIDANGYFYMNSGYGSSAKAYGCRAWVNFNGTGTVAIRASGNISSITDDGTGKFRPNFATAMPDSNYSVIAADIATGTYGSVATSGAVTICGVIDATQAFITVQATSGAEYDSQGVFMAVFR